jgi:hypothetical protein
MRELLRRLQESGSVSEFDVALARYRLLLDIHWDGSNLGWRKEYSA